MTSRLIPSRRSTLAAGATAAAALVAAPSALGAGAVLERHGATRLTLDAGTAKALAANGVSVAPIGPAAARGRVVSFPVTGGTIADLSTGAGTITHSGGLRLSAGHTVVRLTDFTVRVGDPSVLTARVGTKRLPILTLNTAKAAVGISGGRDVAVSGITTTLTPQAATALNRAFATRLFTRKIALGAVQVHARAFATSVTLDAGLASTLTAVGISAAPVGPAGADSAGRLVFPVSGGSLAAGTFAGTVAHGGGIALTKGATRAELTDFTIDTTTSPPQLTALVAGNRVPILTIGLGSATTSSTGGVAAVGGATLTFTPAAASLLNSTFGLGSALTGTTAFGTAAVRAPRG